MTKELRKALEEAGAVLVRQKKHYVYRLPNGKNVVVSRTAGDHRSDKNTLRDLKRIAA